MQLKTAVTIVCSTGTLGSTAYLSTTAAQELHLQQELRKACAISDTSARRSASAVLYSCAFKGLRDAHDCLCCQARPSARCVVYSTTVLDRCRQAASRRSKGSREMMQLPGATKCDVHGSNVMEPAALRVPLAPPALSQCPFLGKGSVRHVATPGQPLQRCNIVLRHRARLDEDDKDDKDL